MPIELYSTTETNFKGDDESNQGSNKEISDSSDSDNDNQNLYLLINGYEGKHRFDPTATWIDQEESSLIRKVRKM